MRYYLRLKRLLDEDDRIWRELILEIVLEDLSCSQQTSLLRPSERLQKAEYQR